MTNTLDDAPVSVLAEVAELRVELEQARLENELRQESFEQIAKAYDERGWAPLGGYGYTSGTGLRLDTIKNFAENNQQLVINPLIKRGIRIRVSYVFGEGVRFGKPGKNRNDRNSRFRDQNKDVLFSQQACEEMETALCTDGNMFLLLDENTQDVVRIPLKEITNVYVASGNVERKLYIQRSWVESASGVLGDEETRERRVWYPVANVKLTPKETIRPGHPVLQRDKSTVDNKKAILPIAVNKQINWSWGLADLQPVVFWAKSYKEFLEAQFLLVKSLAQFAFKVQSATAINAKRAAAKLAATPVTGPDGRPAQAGGIVGMAGGDDLVAVNKAGANVDFKAGQPLAAMVAAGLEVSLEHLLSDPSVKSIGEETLAMPTVKAMASRQQLFKSVYEEVFEYFGMKNVEVVFPPIQSEPIHRIVQAIVTAASTNGLFKEEIREMLVLALRMYGIDPMPGIPENGAYEEWVTGLNPQAQADAALAAKTAGVNQNPGTKPLNTPPGGSGKKRSPAGAMADGDHEMRKSESVADGGVPALSDIPDLLRQLASQIDIHSPA